VADAARAPGEGGGVLLELRRDGDAELHVGGASRPPVERDLYETLPYPDPAGAIGNACGLPAIALPCGFGKDRLPASFQIMGSAWDEALLCDLGEAYQGATAFHKERPPLA